MSDTNGRVADKVAIVTGAARSIGRAIAVRLAEEGAAVFGVDVDREGLAETAQIIAETGGVFAHRVADVSSSDAVRAFIREAYDRFGRLTTLVNNAGILIPDTVVEMSEDIWDRTLAVNLKSVFLTSKYAIPLMLESGGGSIINIGSVNSVVAEPYLPAYCASKGGVLMLTRQVALDYARQGIRVNAVLPGWVDTPINTPHAERMGGVEEVLGTLPDWQPIGRQGYPQEIANVVLFLASDESSFMTGSAVTVDGGMTAK